MKPAIKTSTPNVRGQNANKVGILNLHKTPRTIDPSDITRGVKKVNSVNPNSSPAVVMNRRNTLF